MKSLKKNLKNLATALAPEFVIKSILKVKELRTEWRKVAQIDELDAKLVAVSSNSLNQEEFCQIKTQN